MGRGGRGKTQVVTEDVVPRHQKQATRTATHQAVLANKNEPLAPQLFYGTCPERSLFEPVRMEYDQKPGGGLWTSSQLDGAAPGESNWTEFCREENFRTNSDKPAGVYQATLSRPAKIFEIDGVKDLEFLRQEFPVAESWAEKTFGEKTWQDLKESKAASALASFMPPFDFKAFADDERYDGFRVTQEAIWNKSMRLGESLMSPFRNWDVETVFWTRWCFEDFKEIKP